MLIRKNTKTFKAIRDILAACKQRPDRRSLIRLYITKAGHSIDDRIDIEGIEGDVNFFYELNYDAVTNNISSSGRQLHESDRKPGIYFFQSNSNKNWEETPFEFDEAIKKEFPSLSVLLNVRKKGKVERFALPTASSKTAPTKSKRESAKVVKTTKKEPPQPSFKLRNKIHFTELDRVVFENPSLTKRDVLNYFDKISDYILPHLKDRAITVQRSEGSQSAIHTLGDLEDKVDVPEWMRRRNKTDGDFLVCNDRDQLLWYVEGGFHEFCRGLSRLKSPDRPDYAMIHVGSKGTAVAQVVSVLLAVKTVISGLNLPSFVKTDGQSGIHIYIPLDSKAPFEAANAIAEYLRKLTRLKSGDLVSSDDSGDDGGVTMKIGMNAAGKSVIAPYSLVAGDLATVAAPIQWQELDEGFEISALNVPSVYKRLSGKDPFRNFFHKKANGDAILKQLNLNYSFLF